MGNTPSTSSPTKEPKKVDPIPIQVVSASVPIPDNFLGSGSLVVGSPLTGSDQYSASSSWMRHKPESSPMNIPYVQPMGESSYKNSPRLSLALGLPEEGPVKMVPVMITWTAGGKAVYLTGSFNGWKKKIKLNKSVTDFTALIEMPVGTHRFKFIVDNEWKCSEELPTVCDNDGNMLNYLEIGDASGDQQGDGLDELSRSNVSLEDLVLSNSPLDSYDCIVPEYILKSGLSTARITDPSEKKVEPPPYLPAHLQKVILNQHQGPKESPDSLPVPSHVTLNHLYACSIRDGVMAVGVTSRYKLKVF